MDTGKITFLFLIFLFVVVVSNYMSVEGFKAKKPANAADKAAKEAAEKSAKADKEAKAKADKEAARLIKEAKDKADKEAKRIAKEAKDKAAQADKEAKEKALQAAKEAKAEKAATQKNIETAKKDAAQAAKAEKAAKAKAEKEKSKEAKQALAQAKKEKKQKANAVRKENKIAAKKAAKVEQQKKAERKKVKQAAKKAKKEEQAAIAKSKREELKKIKKAKQAARQLSRQKEMSLLPTKEDLNKMLKDLESTKSDIQKSASGANKTESNVKQTEIEVKRMESEINTKIAKVKSLIDDMDKYSKNVENSSNKAIGQISGYVTTIDKSIASNKKLGEEIDGKMVTIGNQVKTVKTHTDKAEEIKLQMDKVLEEFQQSSKMILAKMNLAADNYSAAKLTSSAPTTSGFQNMDVIKPHTNVKAFGVTSIDSAYNGQMQLEGFAGTTIEDSAYLNASDLFALEENVIAKLKDFNTAYYEYQSCYRTNNYDASKCSISNLSSKKDAAVTAITAFNTAITNMNKKDASTSTRNADGKYNNNGKRITQNEFIRRHDEIKNTSERVSTLRSELDMKMANLLDKTKGPLPEAQNKHNTENYVAIGWTVLATSLVYYVFVEMK